MSKEDESHFREGAQYFDEQPDAGGNRHYDYISVAAHDDANGSLRLKDRWNDLTTNDIVVLRSMAKNLGIQKDIVDHKDRLALLRCIFSNCENRDWWQNRAYKLEKVLINLKEGLDHINSQDCNDVKQIDFMTDMIDEVLK